MLDPLTALGLASNVIQFVDFTVQLGDALHEIHASNNGATEENIAIEILSKSAKDAADDLVAQLKTNPATKNETHLRDSAAGCSQVSKDVLQLVAKMKKPVPGSIKHSLKATWHTVRNEPKKKKMLEHLDRCQQNLQISLLRLLRYVCSFLPVYCALEVYFFPSLVVLTGL